MKQLKSPFFRCIVVSVFLFLMGTGVSATEVGDPPGEYSGKRWDGQVGIQLVSRGKASFEAICYPNGLPGKGWSGDLKTVQRARCHLGDEGLHFDFGDWSAQWRENRLFLRNDAGKVATLKQVFRESPTLGAAPSPGAVILFRNGDVSALVGGVLADKDVLLPNFASRQRFGAFRLHLEFRTSKSGLEVAGGVFLQGRYELRLMNSFGAVGLHRDCGGVPGAMAPRLNACLPPGSWQTLDVRFSQAQFEETGKKKRLATLSAELNGVSIHDNLVLSLPTRGAPREESNSPDRLLFYGSKDELFFRNVWVLPMVDEQP